jgi:hypothetical protein
VEQIEGKPLRQLIIEQPKGYVNLNYAEGQYTLESQLADMEKAGVDHAIFRLPVWQEWLDLETCKKVNDRMAEYVKRSGGKCRRWRSFRRGEPKSVCAKSTAA